MELRAAVRDYGPLSKSRRLGYDRGYPYSMKHQAIRDRIAAFVEGAGNSDCGFLMPRRPGWSSLRCG